MGKVHWQRGAPAAIREHDTLERIDWSDVFTGTADGAVELSPQAWAAALGRDAPARIRLTLRSAAWTQRNILGLRLQPRRSGHHVIGWKVAAAGDHWFRLEAEGWLGTAHLLLHVAGQEVSIGTLLRYDRRMAAIVWQPVSFFHRQVGIALLGHLLTSPALYARVNGDTRGPAVAPSP